MNLFKPKTTLRDETKNILLNRPQWLTYETIAKETGMTVAWVSQFARDRIPNPGVVYVETLNAYLKEKIGQ